ncbi:MAG: SDR family NAD(P)-dependent oxidoreductase [Pseudomonadales bacterium]|nr:SDR family NAD(P)-dependent oxidoreductase [Pseudomonadales bacterium]
MSSSLSNNTEQATASQMVPRDQVDRVLKQATLEIRRLKAELNKSEEKLKQAHDGLNSEAIAVVGMACRFPGGVDSPLAFWELLKQGREAFAPIPKDRWDLEAYYSEDRDALGTMYVKEAGFLDDVQSFDPAFFGISPREAKTMDPQHRLLLEVAYESLENGGLAVDSLRGSKTGVFVGICFDDYAQRNLRSGDPQLIDAHAALGNNRSIAAGRIAYTFGFQGPTIQLDTTCSSSLVAMHLACQSLRQGESEIALAGGVNLMLSPEAFIGFSRLQALAPDGRCRTFAEDAQGYARGEGCGMLVLKPLSKAQQDGDNILAVVRSSAINHDGASNGLTAPSGPAQTAVIEAALQQAQLEPDQVQYVEAHGTATPLGDPIEVAALAKAHQGRQSELLIGSVKTNFGHLESAAGVAGVIKVILAMQQGFIPAHLNCGQLSSRIPWDHLPVKVNNHLSAWPESAEGVRRAGISSFGMSGTNAHVIMEQAPVKLDTAVTEVKRPQVIALSAKTAEALRDVCSQTLLAITKLKLDQNVNIADFAYSMNTGKSHFAYRYAFIVTDWQNFESQLQEKLKLLKSTESLKPCRHSAELVFQFADNRQQDVQQLISLLQPMLGFAAFAKAFQRCLECFEVAVPAFLTEAQLIALKNGSDPHFAHENLGKAQLRIFLTFAIQYSLAQLWRSWGAIPEITDAVGIGEIARQADEGSISISKSIANIIENISISHPENESILQRTTDEFVVAIDTSQTNLRENTLVKLANLYQSGYAFNWRELYRDHYVDHHRSDNDNNKHYQRIALPNYPFQRKPYWQNTHASFKGSSKAQSDIGCIASWPGTALNLPGEHIKVCYTDLSAAPCQWQNHKVMEGTLFPAAGYVQLVLDLAKHLDLGSGGSVELDILTPLWLEIEGLEGEGIEDSSSLLQSQWHYVKTAEKVLWVIEFFQNKTCVAKAEFSATEKNAIQANKANEKPLILQDEVLQISDSDFYSEYQERGILYDGLFRSLQDIRTDTQTAQAIIPHKALVPYEEFNRSELIDAGLQLCGALMVDSSGYWLPQRLAEFSITNLAWNKIIEQKGDLLIQVRRAESTPIEATSKEASLEEKAIAQELDASPEFIIQWFVAGSGDLVARLGNLQLGSLGSKTSATNNDAKNKGSQQIQSDLYQIQWVDRPLVSELCQGGACAQTSAMASLATSVDAELKQVITRLSNSEKSATYLQVQPKLEQLSLLYFQLALCKLVSDKKLGSLRFRDIAEQFQIVTEHRTLFYRLLSSFCNQDQFRSLFECTANNKSELADQSVDIAKFNLPATVNDAQQDLKDILGELSEFPESKAECALVCRCGESLVDVLIGAKDAITVLFPDGDLSLLTALYETSPGAQVMNQQVVATVDKIISNFPQNRTLKILEVGAGTGGTTAHLLPLLNKAQIQVEYVFSDLSPHFLNEAQQRFVDYDFVEYRTLDIEADSSNLFNSFDLVLAANVLHATADISHTLKQVDHYLAPNGMVLLLEATEPLHWLDLTFGMMPGWWCFSDYQTRPQHALLSVTTWQTLFESMGYICHPVLGECEAVKALPQTVILAQKPTQEEVEKEPITWQQDEKSKNYLLYSASQVSNARASLGSYVPNEILNSVCRGLEHKANLTQTNNISDLTADVSCDAVIYWLPSLVESETLSIADQVEWLSQQLLAFTKVVTLLPNAPRIWFVSESILSNKLYHSMVWGWVQTLQFEYPQNKASLVILEASTTPSNDTPSIKAIAQQLCEELFVGSTDYLLKLNQETRQVARLTSRAIRSSNPERLCVDSYHTLDGLQWQAIEPVSPEANEILIDIAVTGMNFRDVLIALDQYPGKGTLGAEATGMVTAVGEAVSEFAVGDSVMAITANGFDSQVAVDQRLAVKLPDNIDLSEAASLPVAFVTASYCLLTLANLKAGDKVLIHSATGGVGQAAIQIANKLGATVFATASKEKQSTLKALGVENIYDSRSTEFATQILKTTRGRGVDVVLNALPLEFQKASLAITHSQGRFIEIGKGDGLTDAEFFEISPDIEFHRVDISMLCERHPELIATELDRLTSNLVAGSWQPIAFTEFTREQVSDAFRFMQRAKHVGKVLVTQPINSIREQGTYLITGGLGGLGLLVAHWLIEQGAKHLCLLGRNVDISNESLQEFLDVAADADAQIQTVAVDVTDKSAMENLITEIELSDHPLRGVIHAAGVLQDSMLDTLTAEQLQKVLAPKVKGSLILHELTLQSELDCFILFSSAAGVTGAPGQINHASANSFLDGLARYRQSLGLTAQSYSWGAWSKIGSALRYQDNQQMRVKGVGVISPQQGMNIFSDLFKGGISDRWVSSSKQPEKSSGQLHSPLDHVAIMPMNWGEFLQQPLLEAQSFYDELRVASNNKNSFTNTIISKHSGTNQAATKQSIIQNEAYVSELMAMSVAVRASELDKYLSDMIASTLGLSVNELDRELGFFDLGLDSLTALELKNRIQRELKLQLPASVVFDYPNTNALVAYIIQFFNSGVAGNDNGDRVEERTESYVTQQLLSVDDVVDLDLLDKRLEELETLLDAEELDYV